MIESCNHSRQSLHTPSRFTPPNKHLWPKQMRKTTLIHLESLILHKQMPHLKYFVNHCHAGCCCWCWCYSFFHCFSTVARCAHCLSIRNGLTHRICISIWWLKYSVYLSYRITWQCMRFQWRENVSILTKKAFRWCLTLPPMPPTHQHVTHIHYERGEWRKK